MNWDDLLPGQREAVVERLRKALDADKKALPQASMYYPGARAPEVVGSDIAALSAAIERLEGRS